MSAKAAACTLSSARARAVVVSSDDSAATRSLAVAASRSACSSAVVDVDSRACMSTALAWALDSSAARAGGEGGGMGFSQRGMSDT